MKFFSLAAHTGTIFTGVQQNRGSEASGYYYRLQIWIFAASSHHNAHNGHITMLTTVTSQCSQWSHHNAQHPFDVSTVGSETLPPSPLRKYCSPKYSAVIQNDLN